MRCRLADALPPDGLGSRRLPPSQSRGTLTPIQHQPHHRVENSRYHVAPEPSNVRVSSRAHRCKVRGGRDRQSLVTRQNTLSDSGPDPCCSASVLQMTLFPSLGAIVWCCEITMALFQRPSWSLDPSLDPRLGIKDRQKLDPNTLKTCRAESWIVNV